MVAPMAGPLMRSVMICYSNLSQLLSRRTNSLSEIAYPPL